MIPDFANKSELFEWLLANESKLQEEKNKSLKFTGAIRQIEKFDGSKKALSTSYEDKLETGVIRRKVIANVYNWMDSHDDVHLDGTFKEFLKNQTPIFLHDHEYKLSSKVGIVKSVSETKVLWRDLNVDKEGYTTAVIADVIIEASKNQNIYSQYLAGEVDQHSVGMYYGTYKLAINDTSEQYVEHKKRFDFILPLLGNPEKALKNGYFWAVESAGMPEFSAVIKGSNELTYTIENKKEAEKSFSLSQLVNNLNLK